MGKTQARGICGLNKMILQSILLEFLFPFYLTILKVKIMESRKTKDRKTLDLTTGCTFESFLQQV